jgi:dTMP kinase
VANGLPAVFVRDPGSTEVGERLRALVVGPARDRLGIAPWTEALLYTAARAQMAEEIIRPQLATGTTVVCDRYIDSTLAYQGYGLGLPVDVLRTLSSRATGGQTPDCTFFFDVPPAIGLGRTTAVRPGGAGADRIEARGLEFHQRVYEGYLELAAAEPGRWRIIPGDLPIEAAHAAVVEQLRILLREV